MNAVTRVVALAPDPVTAAAAATADFAAALVEPCLELAELLSKPEAAAAAGALQ